MILPFISHYLTASRKGHSIHSPFAYTLCEEVFYNTAGFYDFVRLAEIRRRLLADKTVLHVSDRGAGSRRMKGDARRVCDIARHALSTRRKSESLYRLVHFLNAAHSIEIGTSLGLTGLYLARANPAGRVHSLEGSEALCAFANALAVDEGAANLDIVCGAFDDTLAVTLERMPRLDLAYLDGNHTREATMKYFGMCLARRHDGTVMVVDDINWSPGMQAAWREIREQPMVTLTIDAFYTGYVFFRKDIREKQHLKIWTGR